MKVSQPKAGGDVTITLSLDQALCIASLLGNVGDLTAGPLAGLYDEIGNAVEYDRNGEPTSYRLSDACDRKREWTKTFIQKSHDYLTSYLLP